MCDFLPPIQKIDLPLHPLRRPEIIAKALKLKTLAIFYFSVFPTFSPHLQSFSQKFFSSPQISSPFLILTHQKHKRHLEHLNFIQSD